MMKRYAIAASNQEMYAVLRSLMQTFNLSCCGPDGLFEPDPLAFNHLPHDITLMLLDDAVIKLHTTRFGVDVSGKPVCYPGWVQLLAPEMDEAICAILFKGAEKIEHDSGDTYVYPDAAFFISQGSISDDTRGNEA